MWKIGRSALGTIPSGDRDSIRNRVQHFIEHGEGRYVQIILEKALGQEIEEAEDLYQDAYAPQVASELARRKGRIEVLRSLLDGTLGLSEE